MNFLAPYLILCEFGYTSFTGGFLKVLEQLFLKNPNFRTVFPLYQNQSIDLNCKSSYWFVYGANIGVTWASGL